MYDKDVMQMTEFVYVQYMRCRMPVTVRSSLRKKLQTTTYATTMYNDG